MQIVVNEELKAYIDPLTVEEYEALERSILAEGCRDALVLWGEVLVDGHNRYAICQKHGLPFQTRQSQLFQSLEDVHLWMIDQHLGRRSVSDFQRGVLALRKREIVAQRRARMLAASSHAAAESAAEDPPWDDGDAPPASASASPSPRAIADAAPLKSREDLAKAARLRSSQVLMIEKIHKQAAPEVVAAVKSGALSLSAAAAVASLPADEQQAAARGGTGELKQAARRVREAKRQPREASTKSADDEVSSAASTDDQVRTLQARVAELTAENEALRKQVANLLAQLIK